MVPSEKYSVRSVPSQRPAIGCFPEREQTVAVTMPEGTLKDSLGSSSWIWDITARHIFFARFFSSPESFTLLSKPAQVVAV